MFLLRCVFWLSVVYASMSWGGSAFQHHGSFEAATAGQAALSETPVLDMPAFRSPLVEQAASAAARLCKNREIECVEDAASLTALVQKSIRADEEANASTEELVVQAVEAPMAAPRRRVAGRILTRSP